jgi:hypothetical protein
MLTGGDRRSTGRSQDVVEIVLANPKRFGEVYAGLEDPDPLVRMRAADALEKITAQRPELLRPYKTGLLDLAARAVQQEVRWHLAQMLPRLDLDGAERRAAFETLVRYLDDPSRIVVTFAMQALADLAQADPALLPEVLPHIERLARTGSPAMRSRGKKLLAVFWKSPPPAAG